MNLYGPLPTACSLVGWLLRGTAQMLHQNFRRSSRLIRMCSVLVHSAFVFNYEDALQRSEEEDNVWHRPTVTYALTMES